jgi:hypothetical protein
MKLRIARHTLQLQPLVEFYKLLGLEVLGQFSNHNNYDGIFLGLPDAAWHLEFTVSDKAPVHWPDDDDLLVFYPQTAQAYQALIAVLKANCVPSIIPQNPYWQANGKAYVDPDGYGVIIAAVNA